MGFERNRRRYIWSPTGEGTIGKKLDNSIWFLYWGF